MLQLSSYAPPQDLKAKNQRVGNQSEYKLKSTPQTNPNLLAALREKITNNDLVDIGISESRAVRTEPRGKIGPREQRQLDYMLYVIKKEGVTEDTLQHFVSCNITNEEVVRAVTRLIPTGLAGAALSFFLNGNPTIPKVTTGLLYIMGTMTQSVRSEYIRSGLEVLKRNAFTK